MGISLHGWNNFGCFPEIVFDTAILKKYQNNL